MAYEADRVQKDLSQEDVSPFHKQILTDSKALVDMSRQKMGQYYDKWDKNIEVFEGFLQKNTEDQKARERSEPQRLIVPIAYSQIMTFVSFCYTLYTQRERVFELVGMSEEDHKPAKIGEAFLARDLSYNVFEQKLFQFLLDIARCSLGVFKTSWIHETQMTRKMVEKPIFSLFGVGLGKTSEEQMSETTKYLGNRIENVSPYRFFPDTRLPLHRFQEGEFVASEDEYSVVQLKQMEHDGFVKGVDLIKPITQNQWRDRGPTRSAEDLVGIGRSTGLGQSGGQSKGTVLVTEVQRVLIPKKYMVDGKPLGPEDYPIKYLLWYANDNRIIRCEPLNYLHNEFTYSVAQFTPDQHNLVNMSLSDSIDALQSIISWFINSHITSVRKVIDNRLVVDPNGIMMEDLVDRKPVIRLKQSAAGGIDRYVKQLDVSDVTSNHLTDVEILQKLVQTVTGITDNMLGQFHQGRRSATEAGQVQNGAFNRLKMVAATVYRTALEPMARQMLSNLRDGLDEKTMVRLVGIEETAESGRLFAKADKSDLVGNFDFEIFDGTLPSEKHFNAQALQEVLAGLMSNPEAAIALQLDPKAILLEMLELRGVRDPKRFTLKPPPPGMMQPNGLPQTNAPGAVDPSAPPGGEPLLSILGGAGQAAGGGGA